MSLARLRKALTKAAGRFRRRGAREAVPGLLAWGLARLTGSRLLVCVVKPIGGAVPGTARRLHDEEILRSSLDAALDMPREFVDTALGSECYGVVTGDRVSSYAWSASGCAVSIFPGIAIEIPGQDVYVYRAFTDPAFRGRGHVGECLHAIDATAAARGRHSVCAFIELHNRSSLHAFRGAGFTRRGVVLLQIRHRWIVRLSGGPDTPCAWLRPEPSSNGPRAHSAVHSDA